MKGQVVATGASFIRFIDLLVILIVVILVFLLATGLFDDLIKFALVNEAFPVIS